MPSIDSRPASVVGHGTVSACTGLKSVPASTMSAAAAVTSVRPPNSLTLPVTSTELPTTASASSAVPVSAWKTKTPSEAPSSLGSGPVPGVWR